MNYIKKLQYKIQSSNNVISKVLKYSLDTNNYSKYLIVAY